MLPHKTHIVIQNIKLNTNILASLSTQTKDTWHTIRKQYQTTMEFPKKTILLLGFLAASASGFSMEVSRRNAIQAVVGGAATAVLPTILPANAVVDEETPRVITRMGGLLVRKRYFGSFSYLP